MSESSSGGELVRYSNSNSISPPASRSPHTAHVSPALRLHNNMRLGRAVGTRPLWIASRAFSRRIGSSRMNSFLELASPVHAQRVVPTKGTSMEGERYYLAFDATAGLKWYCYSFRFSLIVRLARSPRSSKLLANERPSPTSLSARRSSKRPRRVLLTFVSIDTLDAALDVVLAPAAVVMARWPNARTRVHLKVAERVKL